MKDHDQKTAPALGVALSRAAGRREALEVDVARYQAYLDDPRLSDDEKEEIIRAVWSIMMVFVEHGFGVHPTQQACGQVPETTSSATLEATEMVDCEDTDITKEFNDAPSSD